MEQHLQVLAKKAIELNAQRQLIDNVNLALDTIQTQKISFAFKGWQIREKSLSVLKEVIESQNATLCKIALEAIEQIVINPDLEGLTGENNLDDTDLHLFSAQVIDSLQFLPSIKEKELQVLGLKVILRLCCDFGSIPNGELVISIFQLCAGSCSKHLVNSDVHRVAEALACQAVGKLASCDLDGSHKCKDLKNGIGLARFFLQELDRTKSNACTSLNLECVLSIIKSLKFTVGVTENKIFLSFLRCELFPKLVTAITSINFNLHKIIASTSRKNVAHLESADKTFDKEIPVAEATFLHRKLFTIVVELTFLLSRDANIRRHLALLFAHLLSPLSCHNYSIPYTLIKQLWAEPRILFNLSGPYLLERRKDHGINPTILLQMIFNALMVSSSPDRSTKSNRLSSAAEAMICINSLFSTLLGLMLGEGIGETEINCFFNHLESKFGSDGNLSDDMCSNDDSTVAVEDDVTEFMSEVESVEDDVWLSTEDLHAISSPCYFSAVEDDPDDVNSSSKKPSKLFELMKYVSESMSSSPRAGKHQNDDVTVTSSTTTATPSSSSEVLSVTSSAEKDDPSEEISKHFEALATGAIGDSCFYRKLRALSDDDRQKVFSLRHFRQLARAIPTLLQLDRADAIDLELQRQASAFCAEIVLDRWGIPVHADSVYALFYHVMFLTVKLKASGHYLGQSSRLPCVKSAWIAAVQRAGVHLGAPCLTESFRLVVTEDVFRSHAASDGGNSALFRLLAEMEAMDGDGDIQCSRWTSPPSFATIRSRTGQSRGIEAGCGLAAEIVKSVWEAAVEMWRCSTCVAATGPPAPTTDCYNMALNGLSCATQMLWKLGLIEQTRQGMEVLAEGGLSTHLIPFHIKQDNKTGRHQLSLTSSLCMDVILDAVLDVCCQQPYMWHVFFKVATCVSHMQLLFGTSNTKRLGHGDDDDAGNCEASVMDIFAKSGTADASWRAVLSGRFSPSADTDRGFMTSQCSHAAIKLLASKVEVVFSEIMQNFTLQQTSDFVTEVCKESENLLFATDPAGGGSGRAAALLVRFVESFVTSQRRRRPMLLARTVIDCISPLLVKISAHDNQQVAVVAVECMCYLTLALVTARDASAVGWWAEADHFRFNSSLVRSLDHVFEVEERRSEIQDKVLKCIYNLVKTCPDRVSSGWQPLFNILTSNITLNGTQDLVARCPAVLDILDAFARAYRANSAVLLSAGRHYVTCLFKLLRSNNPEFISVCTGGVKSNYILRNVKEAFELLLFLYNAEKSRTENEGTDITSLMADVEVVTPPWKAPHDIVASLEARTAKYFSSSLGAERDDGPLHQGSGTGRSKLLDLTTFLIDLMIGANVATRCVELQREITQLFHVFVDELRAHIGTTFCLHSMTTSALPHLSFAMKSLFDSDVTHDGVKCYKQTAGSFMEITCDLIRRLVKSKKGKDGELCVTRAWHSYLNLCVQLIDTRREVTARLGSAYFRHAITDLGPLMTSSMSADAIECTCFVMGERVGALCELLGAATCTKVANWRVTKYGDARASEDRTALVWKVFQSNAHLEDVRHTEEGERSWLVYESPRRNFRISVDDMACDISVLHHMLQCAVRLILGSCASQPWQESDTTPHTSPSATSSLHSTVASAVVTSDSDDDVTVCGEHQRSGGGLLGRFNDKQLYELLTCVGKIYVACTSFNGRSSLRRLIQHAFHFRHPANLYQLASTAYDVYVRIVLCLTCRAIASRVSPVGALTSSPGRKPRGNILVPETYDDVDDPRWAYRLLRSAALEIVQPWNSDDDVVNGAAPVDDACSPFGQPDDDDVIDVCHDYLAYVKPRDAATAVAACQPHPDEESRCKETTHKQDGARVASSVGVGENKTRRDLFRLRKSKCENSSHASVTVPVDDDVLHRDMWALTATNLLTLLTSAPDDVLHQLLPVVYHPLTGVKLASCRPPPQQQPSPQWFAVVSRHEQELDRAFNKWLLRVGACCAIVSAPEI